MIKERKERDMKRLYVCIVFSLAFLLIGCSTISVNHDYDPDFNFSSLRTYDLLPVPAKAARNELVVKRVVSAVKQNLDAKGIIRDSRKPDFLIAIHGGRQTKVDVVDWGYSYGRYGMYRGPRRVDVYEYQEGTLIIDFVDARTRELFWRGTATGVIDPYRSPEERGRIINEAVAKVLDKFPPAK
jgi:hypothetical protein